MESSNKCSPYRSLPLEIINEILLRLPVRSLLKFKCVCKSWLISISSSQYIKTHLDISTKSNNYSNYQVILASRFPITLSTCPLSSIFNNTVVDNLRAFDFPMSVLNFHVWFVGSCNGLLCVSIDTHTLVLYNPSTRKLKTLPVSGTDKENKFYISYGFCYDKISDDFIVVELNKVCNQESVHNTEVKVYSPRNDYWRKIENYHDGRIYSSVGKSVGAILHWSICSSSGVYLIFAVNTVTNMYDTLVPPKDDGEDGISDWSLGELNGCLSVFCDYYKIRLDVWAMKEYGVKESWSKVGSIPFHANPSGHLWPLFVLGNDGFCLAYRTYMMLYNSRNNSFTTHDIDNTEGLYLVAAPPYIESLVEPSFLEE